MEEIIKCDNSNERYSEELSCFCCLFRDILQNEMRPFSV